MSGVTETLSSTSCFQKDLADDVCKLIYGMDHEGISIDIITSSPGKIKLEHTEVLGSIGRQVPSERSLQSLDYLVQCLCKSLQIPREDCTKLLAEEKYVLTLDYTLKMLNIHERRQCGVPVIIEGETGVGKTALIEMLSKLWNISQRNQILSQKKHFLDYIKEKLNEHQHLDPESYGKALEIIRSCHDCCHTDGIRFIAKLPVEGRESMQFFTFLRDYILKIKANSCIFMEHHKDIYELFNDFNHCGTLETTVLIADAILNSEMRNLFYKLSIHSALTPERINDFFEDILQRADDLQRVCSSADIRTPTIVVFLDELNTSSCGGVLKEIIVDRSLFGKLIPHNIFVIGACNPHRGNSVCLLEESNPDLWARSTYYVRPLHPTLRFLVWDYGALDCNEEKEYVLAKMKMIDELTLFKCSDGSDIYEQLTNLIVNSQEEMRENVFHFIKSNIDEESDHSIADRASKSCVSQRDIQRVFTFYNWFLQMYSKFSPHGCYQEKQNEYQRRAVLVSLAIVYYLRQPDFYRKKYERMIESTNFSEGISFSQAFNDDLDWMMCQIKGSIDKNADHSLPPGIAMTSALRENIFAMIACICTKTPLIIVGEPGSSKTLSFHIVAENLRGHESVSSTFKHDTNIFPSIDPYFHQCSRHTTSNDIKTVFERAKVRQETVISSVENKTCVVFLDEAGLPEESLESLKALHYYLDESSVAFVGISNHVLDAAKTNRCVSVVRMKTSKEELEMLARGCLSDIVPFDLERVVKFCCNYFNLMKEEEYKNFFGLRDFIHFLQYLQRSHKEISSGKLVLKAIERNFNGKLSFRKLVLKLMDGVVEGDAEHIVRENSRSIVEVLQDSLSECPSGTSPENTVRYKLIIDPSKDNSLIRYLFKFGVVKKENTRMFMRSDAFNDEEAQKVTTVSAICHSVTEGHTVILSQTDDIHESFYDLYNLRYRCIDDPGKGRLFYANVAIGAYIKPCPVNVHFQCIVLCHEDDIGDMPAPFLNRFEKYHITYDTMLESAMKKLPRGWCSLMEAVKRKVEEFAVSVEGSVSIYGYCKETSASLLLWFLPSTPNLKGSNEKYFLDHSTEREQFLLELVVNMLRDVGFHIPHISNEEIELDIMSLFRILRFNVAFAEYIERLTDHSVMVAISEALEVLNNQSCYQNRDLSVGACLMISLILQWTVRHLCKALMQVMTPEGLVAFHKKIPSSYVLNYLENQAHFSLEKLIFCQNRTLQNNSGPSCTKFLVHCRTSDLIMDLPFNAFRHHLLNFSQSSPPAEEKVTFLSMSTCHTEGVFLERLHDFYSSKELCILILKVNMQETSLKAINHIRMMIEDVENQNSTQTKIAVVLLHFPSSMFSEGTYPSLFQEGWSHHYLDSVSMSREPHTVNTEQWIKQCCLSSDCVMKEISTSLQQLTRKSIPLVIPLLASKLKFCKGKDTNARKQMYTELLIDKEFGEHLCIKFQDYWKPPLLAAFLEKAAAIIFRRESSVSMTSLIQNLVHSKFSEFVMYMVSEMMETNSRDLLLGPDCPTLISSVLKEIVCTMDLIEFSQLSRQNVLQQKRSQHFEISRWVFPFYMMLSKTVDDLIEECEREVKQESISFEETDSPDIIVLPNEIKLTSIVKDHIHQIMDVQNQPMKRNWRSLAVALKFVDKHECLLERYFCDFISDKLTIVCVSNGVVFDVFKEYFNNLAHCVEKHHESDREHAISRRVMKLIMFHISFRYHQDSLAGILPILKQLAEVQLLTNSNDASVTTPDLTVYRDNALSLLSDPKCLCAYITDLVFSAIVTLWMKNENSAQWFVFYQNMVTNHRVKMILYKYMTPSEEGKLNAMHTAYVMLHCDISDGKLKGQSNAVFWTLYAKFFKDLELKDVKRWPQLKDCASVTLNHLECSQTETVYVVLHGLLDHFFSEHRSRFHSEDVNWFLELASEKVEWKRQYIRIFTDNASDGIPFGVIKHYLLRVMTHEKIVDGRKVHFAGFNKQYRSAVGDALSMFENDISVQYSPYFYFEVPYPEQPLAHIYFLIVLETLLGNTTLSQYNVKELISKVMKDASSPAEHYVCTIEQQALLQKLLQQIAEAQASGRLGYTLSTMQFDSLMSEVSSSDMLPEHGTVIAMHLLHQSRNLSKLRQHMEHLYKNGVGCLGSHIDRLKTQPVVKTDPKLIRLMENKHLCDMYTRVCKAMKQFKRTGSDDDAKKLLHGTYTKWSESMLHLLPGKIRINNKDCLKMMMWLVAYHQFYLEKIPFPELINVIKMEQFIDATQVKLFEVLLGGFKPESCHSTLLDEIFYPRSITCQDQTHMEMRDCIVNIIAIVFGSPSGSNHLWYHLMEPKTLDGTFLTGFMVCSLALYSQNICIHVSLTTRLELLMYLQSHNSTNQLRHSKS